MDNALFQTPVEEKHTVSPQQSNIPSLEDILLLTKQAFIRNNQGYTSCQQDPAHILTCPGDATPEGPSEEDSLYPSDKNDSPGNNCNSTGSSSGSGPERKLPHKGTRSTGSGSWHNSSAKSKSITRRKGGGTPLGYGATLGANTFYNKFNLLPLITMNEKAAPSSSDKEEDTTITSIMQQIKAKPKRKWKHSKLFPSNKENSSDSAEELIKQATNQRCPETPVPASGALAEFSKHINQWTPREWAQILGVKWPIEDLKDKDQGSTSKIRAGTTKAKKGIETQRKEGRCFNCNKQGHFISKCPKTMLSTPATRQKDVKSKNHSASHICTGSTKNQVTRFSPKQWCFLLWPASEAKKKWTMFQSHTTCSGKEESKTLIKPSVETVESFIKTARSMTIDQKCKWIENTIKDPYWDKISPA
jgi:hypothetical protein